MASGDSIELVLTRVETARQQLSGLNTTERPAEAACALGRTLSEDIADLLHHTSVESPAARAAARAAGERFDSHVLAASLLEASHASTASVFELIGRGLIRLTADVERLARARRLPA